MRVPRRRYRVSLVGFDESPRPRARPFAGATRRAGRAWSSFWALSWQLRAALVCVLLALIILAFNFA